jgi:peptide methionine sulfoxide reductase msrA/msrB
VPVDRLEAEGYGEYKKLFGAVGTGASHEEVAILAGGCFWGVEELIRKLPGVLKTEVGYTGGAFPNPTYEKVSAGTSGHAESVRTQDRQGNDRGAQYRSAIFYSSPEQERIAREVIAEVNTSGTWSAPIVTQVVNASTWYPAEEYHQDYLQKHPDGYTCHYVRQ